MNIKKHDNGYDSVRCFATLLILIHHFITACKEINLPLHNAVKIIHSRFEMGGVGVGLFFILSGALLWKGNKKELPIKNFYRKRTFRIFIPYWISYVSVLPIIYLVAQNTFRYILNCGVGNVIPIFGLYYSVDFWKQLNIVPGPMLVGEWFTTVIIILYGLFPLLYWLFKNHRVVATIFIAIVFAINLYLEILTYHGGYFSISNGLMYFWLGMLFEEYKSNFNNLIKILSWPIIVLLICVRPSKLFGITYLPCFFLSITTFVYLYYLCVDNCFSKYICRYNYEIYLIHHRIFLILIPLFLSQESSQLQIGICFVVLAILILILAEKLQLISKWVETILRKIS